MSVWIVQTGAYDEQDIIAVTQTKDAAERMALDHSRTHPVSKFERATRYELYEWEPDATSWTTWDQFYARNGEIIKERHTRTDVSALVEAAQ